MLVFAYGSLINLESTRRTIGREVDPSSITPATLHGFQRRWMIKDTVASDALKREIKAVFLDIELRPDSELNGVLLDVTGNEFEALKRREKNYDCVEVSASVVTYPGRVRQLGEVYTFVGRSEHHVSPADSDVFVMQKYIDMVESGCKRIGFEFLQTFHQTTDPAPFEVAAGGYTFVNPA